MVTVKQVTNFKEWEEFTQTQSEANFLMSHLTGETNEKIGHKVYYSGFYKAKRLIGVSLYVLEKAKRATYLTVAGGPLLDWTDREVIEKWIETTKDLAAENKAVFVRVRPQLKDTTENRKLFSSIGFRPAPMHLSAQTTLQLSLTESLDKILMQMRKNTRYEIRKAEKRGIKVTKTQNKKEIETFLALQRETALRQQFIPFRDDYVTAEYEIFAATDQAVLYSAKHAEKLLAQAVVIHYPTESSYHFGGSTLEGRNLPGAYAVQWTAIQDAKGRNIPRYNFWGIVEKEETKHRYYGVSVFKRGFGGEQVNYLPAHDLVINHHRYWPNYLLESYRRISRGL